MEFLNGIALPVDRGIFFIELLIGDRELDVEWKQSEPARDIHKKVAPAAFSTTVYRTQQEVFDIYSSALNDRARFATFEHAQSTSIQVAPVWSRDGELEGVHFALYRKFVATSPDGSVFSVWEKIANEALAKVVMPEGGLAIVSVSLLATSPNPLSTDPAAIGDLTNGALFSIDEYSMRLTASEPKKKIGFCLGRLKNETFVEMMADMTLRQPSLIQFLHSKGLRVFFGSATQRELHQGHLLSVLELVVSRVVYY
jgi:hypothetical protein